MLNKYDEEEDNIRTCIAMDVEQEMEYGEHAKRLNIGMNYNNYTLKDIEELIKQYNNYYSTNFDTLEIVYESVTTERYTIEED